MKRTYVVSSAIVIIAIIAISAGYYYFSAKPSPPPKQLPTVVMGTTKDVTVNLDPAQDYSTGVLNLNYIVFDTLYEIPPGIYPDARLMPRLAASDPLCSSDGLHCTIQLRQGVKFQDGTPFNATAMKFSLDRAITLNSYPAWLLSAVDSVDVVDMYTIRINLKSPDAALMGQLSMPVAAPVSPSAVQNMGLDNFQALPVGTGPFKYVEWQKGDHVTLAPFEDYWNQSRVPKVRLVYQIFTDSAALKLALQKGEIDIAWVDVAVSDYASLLADPNIKYAFANEAYHATLELNMGMPGSPLQDVRVRKAIMFSIDQKEISEKAYNGLYTPSEETLFLPGFDPKPSWLQYKPTNITKAKELLTAAGYPNGVDLTLTFTPIRYGKEMTDVAALLREQLGRAGIRVTLQSHEGSTFWPEYVAAKYEMSVGAMSPDYLDPDSVASFIATSVGAFAMGVHLNDTTLDQLVRAGAATTDPAQREKIYGDIQDRLADLAVYEPLVHMTKYYFYRTSSVTGVPSYYFQSSPWWTIEKTTTT